MRYRLRTLLIVLALGPMVLAGAWWGYRASRPPPDFRAQRELQELEDRYWPAELRLSGKSD